MTLASAYSAACLDEISPERAPEDPEGARTGDGGCQVGGKSCIMVTLSA